MSVWTIALGIALGRTLYYIISILLNSIVSRVENKCLIHALDFRPEEPKPPIGFRQEKIES